MDRKKQAILGLAILIILIIVIVAVTTLKNNKDGISDSNLKQVFVATGGGKENGILQILRKGTGKRTVRL